MGASSRILCRSRVCLMKLNFLLRLWRSVSPAGMVLGTLFFAAALTPSLIPSRYLTQGVLSGCAMAAGYGLGVLGHWLTDYLELPGFAGRPLTLVKLTATAGWAAVIVLFLEKAAAWINSIPTLMDLEPVDTIHPLEVGSIGLAALLILLGLARLFRLVLTIVSTRTGHFLPRRIST